MGCHRSQRSSGICESVYFVLSCFTFPKIPPGQNPWKSEGQGKLRDISFLLFPFLPRMKVSSRLEISFPGSFLAPLYIVS